MRRVDTTFDLLEAHIVVGLLRDNGVDAWTFDVDMVRQDWFKTIAFGGFRVLADDASAAEAREIVRRYRSGEFSIQDETDTCPRCAQNSCVDDYVPRRLTLLAIYLFWVVEAIVFGYAGSLPPMQLTAVFTLQLLLYLCVPWLAISFFKWRKRCLTCKHRWRESPSRFADLSQLAAAAENSP